MNNSYGSGKAIQSKEYTKSRDDDFGVDEDQSEMISLKHRLLNERDTYKDMIVINNDDELIDDHDISGFENERKKRQKRPKNGVNVHNNSNSAWTDDEHIDIEKLNLL